MSLIQQIQQASQWEQRYRLIIQAAKNQPRPEEQELAQMQLISGCEAKVWFNFKQAQDRSFRFSAYSESRVINGLLWLLVQAIQDSRPQQLQTFSLSQYFSQLGIAQRLSQTRLNGLAQIEKIIHQLGEGDSKKTAN